MSHGEVDLPDTLQVHRADLNNVADLFAFQYSISSASGHTGNVQEFCAIDHVIIC